MGRPNPKNNPTMQRVEAPAPVIVKTNPPVKSTAKKPTSVFTPANAEQDRNVTQPVKKPTEWCGCEPYSSLCSHT